MQNEMNKTLIREVQDSFLDRNTFNCYSYYVKYYGVNMSVTWAG